MKFKIMDCNEYKCHWNKTGVCNLPDKYARGEETTHAFHYDDKEGKLICAMKNPT